MPFAVIGFTSLVELFLVSAKPSIQVRLYIASILVIALTASQTAILWLYPSVLTIVFWTIGVFRVINMMRYAAARMHETYLKKVVRRSSVRLLGLQLVALATVYGLGLLSESGIVLALALSGCILLAIVAAVIKNTRKVTLPKKTHLVSADLPTVTVAIPARNETEDLAFCIESLVASNYPKLEILVLDDCSQDNTPEVIKSFAHKGVRFLSG